MEFLPWARRVDGALRDLNLIPLFGNAPSFDLNALSAALSSQFASSPFSLQLGDASWKDDKDLKAGLGKDPFSLSILASPLAQEALWLMARQDVAHLASWLLHGTSRGKTIDSELLQEGFYRFVALNALEAVQGLAPLQTLTLSLNEGKELGLEKAWCIEVGIAFEERTCWGRLVLSESFLSSWRNHFSSLRKPQSLSPLARNLEISLSLTLGSVGMAPSALKELKEGDVLLFDRKGSAEKRLGLHLGSTPLFNARVDNTTITLLDRAPVYEDMMNQEHAAENEQQELRAIGDMPLSVAVELAQLKMTVEHLLSLTPGNTLELPLGSEQNVALAVNGRIIGRGEIIQLGETLGVRILEITRH